MYYVLTYEVPQDENEGYLDLQDGLDFDGVDSWSLGQRFLAALPDPIEVDLIPVSSFRGEPSEMYDGNMCLMSARLVSALLACGVDNIDHYRAVLKNTETGQTYSYRAVNIVGLIAATDLASSVWESHDGDARFDTSFDALAVNEDKALGALIFRLAENTSTILIHAKVRDHLLSVGFPTLRFLKPSEWVT
ncbi:imm11 family protein [Sorangium sp. So ce145]|uniref:imm11 family protein n=1 Tax=Sorangium sp. So ce145 TaxID=3133285 RepID=UPI003F6462A6